MLSPVLPSY